MMITGLNHITLAVKDIDTSLAFYQEALGFKAHVKWEGGAYLSAGDLWLCLSKDDAQATQDYTHIAFTVPQALFEDFTSTLVAAGIRQWKQNSSEGDSLYLLDPDGHKLEIHSGDLTTRLESLKAKPYQGLTWL
jgi:catechol 2,3-dioxygenase-like lactoylglutathione lyase family enzyme